jgi:hypothetical protein
MISVTSEFQKSCEFKYNASYFPPRYGNKRVYAPFSAVDGLLELPLAFMDSDFAEMQLMSSNALEVTWTLIERVLEEYRKNEGVCTFLWHPLAFYDETNEFHNSCYRYFERFEKLYKMILQYGTDNCDKLCSCVEVTRLCKSTGDSMR